MRASLLLASTLLALALPAATAQSVPTVTTTPNAPPELKDVVNRLLSLTMWVAWMVVFGMGVYVAIKFMTGDKEAVSGLRNWLIGLILLASVLSIASWIAGGGG